MKGRMNNAAYIKITKTISSSQDECPVCHGSGYIIREVVTDAAKEVYGESATPCPYSFPCPECEGAKAKRLFEVKSRSDIPASFSDKRMKDFLWDKYTDITGSTVSTENARKFTESFVNDFEKWQDKGIGLYIYSQTKGSGKTYLASCICNELMQKYPMVTKFVSVSKIIDISKKYEASKDYKAKDPIELMQECKLLVLDDIGQKNTGIAWLDDLLFKILDARYQKRLVTIFTSNLKPEELDLEDRIVDRIVSMNQVIQLPEWKFRFEKETDIRAEFFESLGIV